MANYPKKAYFKEATVAQIKKDKEEVRAERDLVDRIEALGAEQFLVVPADVFQFQHWGGEKKFKKHGPEVKPRRFRSIDECVRLRLSPRQRLKDAFDNVRKGYQKGYSFNPLDGNDKRKRVVPLVEVLEGARLFTYAHNFPTSIDVEADYTDAARVARDGGSFLVSVPSRRKKVRRYKLMLKGVPVTGHTPYRVVTPYRFRSQSLDENQEHCCGAKMFSEFRFTGRHAQEGSDVYRVCAHEVAAMYEVAYRMAKHEKNEVPLRQMIFPLPTKRIAEFYSKLRSQVLLESEDGSLRRLNKAHMEVFLWNLVASTNYDATFNPNFQRDGYLENYTW